MAKTASDLADQVLRELTVLDAVSASEADDSSYIQTLSQTYHDTLTAFQVNVTWSHSSIPERVFMPLAKVLADVAARSYGKAVSEQDETKHLRALKAAAANSYLGIPETAEFF